MLHSRVTFGHNTLLLNEHFNTDGTVDTTKVKDTIVLDDRQSGPEFRDTRDAYHVATGGALGRVHKGLALWRLRGRILVPNASQLTRLSDRERSVRAALDPELCYADSPTTDGAYALDWDELTTDTGVWATGRIPSRIYVRPADQPFIIEDIKDRASRQLSFGLIAADPRIYGQTEQTVTMTPGSPSPSVVNRGTVLAPWKMTITMAGAGSATWGVNQIGDGILTFQLDLSGRGSGDVIVVYGETCGPYGRGRRITLNGVDNFALKSSAVNTWFMVQPGTQTITMSNFTNVTSCVFTWYHAWA